MHICTYVSVVGNMALSAKDVIEKYNVKLMEKLPLENPIFFGMMKEAKLFHLGTDTSISQEPTRAKKVTYYLQHAFSVQPDEDFPILCEVMKKSKISGLVKLAEQIEAEAKPGTYVCTTYVHMHTCTCICMFYI